LIPDLVRMFSYVLYSIGKVQFAVASKSILRIGDRW